MKFFGKRGADPTADLPVHDPRSNFALAPLPRPAGPPASSTPLADQLARPGPGVTENYVVVPRSLAEQMPLSWQRQVASVLAQFHHTHRQLSWPLYRVLPSREEKLVDLDEEQLAEAGYVVEIDATGELVYRERSGRKVEDPEQKRVMVTCLDPVAAAKRTAPPPYAPLGGERPPPPALGADAPTSSGPPPAPMNIGPQPVWNVVGDQARQETTSPPPPPPPPPPVRPSPPPASPASRPAQPPPSQPVPPEPAKAEQTTPPRGVPAPEPPQADPIDWFSEPAEPDAAVDSEELGFGPTGDPIERPYRFRP